MAQRREEVERVAAEPAHAAEFLEHRDVDAETGDVEKGVPLDGPDVHVPIGPLDREPGTGGQVARGRPHGLGEVVAGAGREQAEAAIGPRRQDGRGHVAPGAVAADADQGRAPFGDRPSREIPLLTRTGRGPHVAHTHRGKRGAHRGQHASPAAPARAAGQHVERPLRDHRRRRADVGDQVAELGVLERGPRDLPGRHHRGHLRAVVPHLRGEVDRRRVLPERVEVRADHAAGAPDLVADHAALLGEEAPARVDVDVWASVVAPWGLHMTGKDELWVCGSSPVAGSKPGEWAVLPPPDQVVMDNDANAACYIEAGIGDRILWGVGIHPSIVTASLRAVINAVNRILREKGQYRRAIQLKIEIFLNLFE